MDINKELIVPYCIAIAVLDLICTAVIAILVIVFMGHMCSWRAFVESYCIGYAVLWFLNLKLLEE